MPIPSDDNLPEMNDAMLDAEQLAALFRDYRSCVEVREILVKYHPGRIAEAPQPTLDEAERLLAARQVRGLQVRYQHDGAQWCDTLMPAATPQSNDCVRLVRIRHDLDERSNPS